MNAAVQICPVSHHKKVLLIDKDQNFCVTFKHRIERLGIDVDQASSIENLEKFFSENHKIEAVLVDSDFEGASGSKLIRAIVHKLPRTKVFVLMSDYAVQMAPSFLENGASNIYPLSLGADKIAETISYILNGKNSQESVDHCQDYSAFVGQSRNHIAVLEQISRIKDASASVLITGESGTGKELVARALHESSLVRSKGKFEAINCGAIPESLLESELFGHKRGAFTDAKAEKKGLFEVCSDGVLFLDEIGEMPLQLQVKLLRVLQEKEVRQLGSTQSVKVNTRIVAATNLDLLKEVERGRFRKDLYYRLAVLKIHMPSLRERPDDIPLLINHFIDKFSEDNDKTIRPLSASQMGRLKLADWPGNIRELQNAIERAVVLSADGQINLNDIFEEGYCGTVSPEEFNFDSSVLELPLRHADAKKVFESVYLKNLLKHSKGNVTEAAKMADKTRVELYRYLARNHIVPAEFRA
ncbi:MAG: sigma-54 dependent transcriptional regulator [Bdellovibrionota bacterium]